MTHLPLVGAATCLVPHAGAEKHSLDRCGRLQPLAVTPGAHSCKQKPILIPTLV